MKYVQWMVCIAIVASLTIGTAVAQTSPLAAFQDIVVVQGMKHKISSKEAKRIAVSQYGGKAESKVLIIHENSRWYYIVKVKSGNVTRRVAVDAESGRIADSRVISVKQPKHVKAVKKPKIRKWHPPKVNKPKAHKPKPHKPKPKDHKGKGKGHGKGKWVK